MHAPGCALAVAALVAMTVAAALAQDELRSEFLHSFLGRAHMLPNASAEETQPKDSPYSLTVSLHVDNWSAFRLVSASRGVASGGVEPTHQPRDMAEKRRGLVLRGLGGMGAGGTRTAAIAAWTLQAADGVKISLLSVAWDVRQHDFKVAVGLGDYVPDFDSAWARPNGAMVAASLTALDEIVSVADSRTTVAAQMSLAPGGTHYFLTVSVIPQNIDVWGWMKYYHETGPEQKKSAPPTTSKTTTTSAAAGSARVVPRDNRAPADQETKERALVERKNLLLTGPSLSLLRDSGRTIRDALRDNVSGSSVGAAFHVENWTRFRLAKPSITFNAGRSSKAFPPVGVDPGEQEVGLVANEVDSVWGSSGVLRWNVGATGTVMSVMWSVPYNRQLWRTWLAVGLSTQSNTPTFDYMYSGKDDQRFVRHEAGGEFEFSDGKFILKARMDGGATFKPVVHVSFFPMDEADLAASIRRKLGLAVVRKDDLREPPEEPSQFGLVQGGTQRLGSWRFVVTAALLAGIGAGRTLL